MAAISEKDIKAAVANAIGSNASILGVKIEPFSKSRLGMMANHHSITVNLESSEPLQFFAKTSSSLQDFTDHEWYHQEELEFLRHVYPRLRQEDKWSPRCYLATPEVLIFENLRSKRYAIRQSGLFDKDSLSSALSALARFHASSINLETSLDKTLDCEYPGMFREKIFTDSGKGGSANKLGFETMALIAKDFGMDAELVPKILERLYEVVKPKPGKCNVICHGDLWRTNLMFNDQTNPPHCLLVDYQMLRYASPTVDLAMLLHTHSDPEHPVLETQLVRHYYSILQKSAKVPSWNDFWEDFEESRLVGLAYAAMAWPKTVFVKFMNDPVALSRWYSQERYSTYLECMDADKDYERRLKKRLIVLFDEANRVLKD